MKEYFIGGVRVQFPYEAYRSQIDYMARVIEALETQQNALLESPTGTGKTLSLLCAICAWRENRELLRGASQSWGRLRPTDTAGEMSDFQKTIDGQLQFSASSSGIPTVIYASRTHSQLTQVVRELKKTTYSPPIAVLGSREQLCVHPEAKKKRGAAQNMYCKILCRTQRCEYREQFVKKQEELRASGQTDVMDIEDLVKEGEKRTICPFYWSRLMRENAYITLVPYNYLVHRSIRKRLRINLENMIVVCDEAHNLEEWLSQSASFDLSALDIARCVMECQRAASLLDERLRVVDVDRDAGPGSDAWVDGLKDEMGSNRTDILKLKETLLGIEERLLGVETAEDGTRSGDSSLVREIIAGKDTTMTKESAKNLLRSIRSSQEALAVGMIGEKGDSSLPFDSAESTSLEQFHTAIRTLYPEGEDDSYGDVGQSNGMDAESSSIVDTHCKVFIERMKQRRPGNGGASSSSDKTDEMRVIHFWCFSPSVAMREVTREDPHCIILTSGTLSPMDSFAKELDVNFPIMLENPHVIDPSQVKMITLKKGPGEYVLNSSFRSRSTEKYMNELGNTIVNYARMIPDGFLVFFPSYNVMEDTISYWKRTKVWTQLSKSKHIVEEKRGSSDFMATIREYEDAVRKPFVGKNGAMMFAVCRGKVSEGVDFSDEFGRAVLVTGIPFPNLKDPRVRMKQMYLEEQYAANPSSSCLRGSQWYVQQASRAVNQAIGRIIRHRRDWGSIILADERFAQDRHLANISAWLRPLNHVAGSFGDSLSELRTFFRKSGLLSASRKEPSLSGEGGVALEDDVQEVPSTATKHSGISHDVPELRLFKTKPGLLKDRDAASRKKKDERSFMDLVHGRAEDWATTSQSQGKMDSFECRIPSSSDSVGDPSKTDFEIHIPQSVEDAILYGKKITKKPTKGEGTLVGRKQQKTVSSEDFLKRTRSSLSSDDYRTFKQSLLGLRTLIKRKMESSKDEDDDSGGERVSSELDRQLDAQFRVLIGLLEADESLQNDLSYLVGKQFKRRYLALLHSCRQCSKQEEDHFLRSQHVGFRSLVAAAFRPPEKKLEKRPRTAEARMKKGLIESKYSASPHFSISQEPPSKKKRKMADQGTRCFHCGKKPSNPFSAPCGHVMCYSCWEKQRHIDGKCPVCSAPFRRSLLTKNYFDS
eukprot:TRINITY_DN32869_c0_g1_i1.p1 TRINITY_DN32869_c0_g1~~TRINITY_DN32869_c0_g1_i1.p1  ORF type:complete len:1161 (+),score=311.51 TRINITY_DN32869_c0_g1_i1:91-3573(+)